MRLWARLACWRWCTFGLSAACSRGKVRAAGGTRASAPTWCLGLTRVSGARTTVYSRRRTEPHPESRPAHPESDPGTTPGVWPATPEVPRNCVDRAPQARPPTWFSVPARLRRPPFSVENRCLRVVFRAPVPPIRASAPPHLASLVRDSRPPLVAGAPPDMLRTSASPSPLGRIRLATPHPDIPRTSPKPSPARPPPYSHAK
jgi:hypothetical protein